MIGYLRLLKTSLQKSKFWSKLIKNISTIAVGQGGASVLNMLTAFVSAVFLGATGYGSLMIGQTFMQTVDALINFQSWQSVIRYGSISLERNDERGLAATIKAAAFVDILSAVVGCVVAFILSFFVSELLGWDEAATVAAIVFCFEIVFHIEGAPTGVLRLFDKFNYVAIHAVVMSIVKLVFVCVSFFLFGANIFVFACAYCAADIIKSLTLALISLVVVHKRIGIRSVVRSRRSDLPIGLISFTIWSNLDTAADVPILYFDVLFLSVLSNEIVGIYKLYKQILSAFSLLSTPVQQAIMPQLAELIAKRLNDQAYNVVKKIEKTVVKIVGPVAVVAAIIVPPVLSFFMGAEYGDYWILFVALTAITFVGITFSALHPCFNAYGFSRQSTFITLLSNIAYLVICYLLLDKLGVMAIPLSMAVQYFLVIFLKSSYIKKNVLDKDSFDACR